MSYRNIKIIIDILMLLLIILSFASWYSAPTFHIIAGSACTLLFAIHVLLNRKWLESVTKNFKTGKVTARAKRLYIIDFLMIIVWGIATITGFLAIPSYINETENTFGAIVIHGVSARFGCILVVVHIFQHMGQIRSYLTRKMNNR